MATARELLAQADALMRRNRLRDAPDVPTEIVAPEVVPPSIEDIPVLTEVVATPPPPAPAGLPIDIEQAIDVAELEAEAAAAAATERALAREAAATGIAAPVGAAAPVDALSLPSPAEAAPDNDVPVLTDAVEDFEPSSILGEPKDADEAAVWASFDDDEVLVPAPAPVVARAAPAESAPAEAAADAFAIEAQLRELQAEATPSVALHAVVPAPLAPARPLRIPDAGDSVSEAARWNALAEEIRMQVLQRIDIFTDTGLQEQLAARLQPIVDRASADLVATINQQIGQLLRSYVAEAIEREIDRWRDGSEGGSG